MVDVTAKEEGWERKCWQPDYTESRRPFSFLWRLGKKYYSGKGKGRL